MEEQATRTAGKDENAKNDQDESSSASANKAQLGYMIKPESLEVLAYNYLPNKVGGRPTWLDLSSIPPTESLKCERCEVPMPLLLQIYAPLNEYPYSYHRMLYLFCCKNGSCHASTPMGCFRLLRGQLPKDNPFFIERTTKEQDESEDLAPYTFNAPSEMSLCMVCGMLAEKRCGNCKRVSYCTKGHQIEHWRNGHKEECTGKEEPKVIPMEEFIEKETKKFPNVLFEEWQLVTEEEEEGPEDILDDEDEIEETKKKLLTNYQKLEEAKKKADEEEARLKGTTTTTTDTTATTTPTTKEEKVDIPDEEFSQDHLVDTKLDIDNAFLKFQCHITKDPEQCLRYSRWEGATPLWVSSKEIPQPSDIPPCGACGGPRVFEFQVLPQVLHYLDLETLERVTEKKAVSFGCLAIYTCAKSCQASKDCPYITEFVWRQSG